VAKSEECRGVMIPTIMKKWLEAVKWLERNPDPMIDGVSQDLREQREQRLPMKQSLSFHRLCGMREQREQSEQREHARLAARDLAREMHREMREQERSIVEEKRMKTLEQRLEEQLEEQQRDRESSLLGSGMRELREQRERALREVRLDVQRLAATQLEEQLARAVAAALARDVVEQQPVVEPVVEPVVVKRNPMIDEVLSSLRPKCFENKTSL